MRLRQAVGGFFVVLLLSALTIPAWSANPPAATPPPVLAKENLVAPVAIEVTEVIPRSVRALDRLQQIREKLDTDTSVTVVEAGLSTFAQNLDEWWKAEASTIKQLGSVQRMNDVLWQWRLNEGQIAAWNGLLETSSKEWSAEEQTLVQLIANWRATQLALTKTAPVAVRDKIIEVLRDGEATGRSFREKTAQLVVIQGKLAAQQERLDEIRTEIEAVRAQSNLDLLSQDSPPLWTALVSAGGTESITAQARESGAKLFKDISGFFQLNRNRLLFHLGLFLVTLALFYRLRYLARLPSDIKPTATERLVLNCSISSAMLLALFIVPLLYSGASPQIMRIGVLPVVIPVLTLLPTIFAARYRLGFYLLTSIYLLDFLRSYLPPQSLLVRLLLLTVACLGAAGIGLMLKARRLELSASSSSAGMIRVLLRIAMALFVISVIANVIGNVSLAEILVSPLVRMLYLGIVTRMGAVVATTFVLMALRSPRALVLRTVRHRGEAVALTLRRLINWIAVVLWIVISLYNVGALENVRSALEQFLDLQWKVGAAEIAVRDFANFILVFFAAYVVSRLLRIILAEEIFPRFHMPRGVPDALELLARYGVLLFGFLLALTSAGVNLSQVMLAISALGVGIGFGLQNIVNNFVSGLILVFEHPIQVGDLVEVGTYFGRVRRIGFRASLVRTLDGAEVIIPNAELIGTKVINWSLSDQLRRITIQVSAPYGTDPQRVIGILQGVAGNHPDVLANPSPSVILDQFGDSGLKFLLRGWTYGEKFIAVRGALMVSVNNALREAGIEIPFPQSDVHMHWAENQSEDAAPIEKPK